MKNGKSPGSDGFTVDFYKFFWNDIGAFVFRSLYFGYETGHFSQFQTRGVITCIPKENKDRRYMSNWRPISLLNTDLKIASAAIANRFKQVLGGIISDTQKGFMKDRFMGENTRLLYDLMHYLEENDMDGLLLLVDFEKAFDSIEWKFLQKALNSFNFGPSICKWFETFYVDSKSCVINNGHISNFFNLERGCRQGDPLSPYLFIIGVELLSLQIKSNPKIKGALVNDTESLISQYADDTFLVLDGCETSLRETLICFENFYKASGLKINTSKTRVVWVGNKRYSNQTLALPKLIHLLTSLPNLKQSLFNDLNKLFFNFIWDGKPEKIKRNTLIADFEDGGLKMIHLQQFNAYLKISWIKRFFSNLKGGWQKIMAKNIKYYGGERIFSLQKEKILEISKIFSNPFWKDVFYSLYLAKPLVKLNIKECLSLDLLNFVSIDDFPFYMRCENAGVTNLNHMMDTVTKNFLTFEKIKTLIKSNNFIRYYTLISNSY